VQQAIAQGYTTPTQVGITGCSYGGYFTTQSITRHPQLYAAANTQCTLVDNEAEWKNRQGIASFSFGNQTPYTDRSRFQEDSPIYNASQVKTPLLIFHGDKDFLPISLIENFYWKVAAQGTPTRMIKFVGAYHGLYTSEYQLYAAQEMIQWFRTYLQAGEQQAEGRRPKVDVGSKRK
jgi:dipeptidyl aminopeptidase/acylaminoacyl peptidase